MTETQATSGIAGTSTAGSPSDTVANDVTATDAADSPANRSAVGRASVPAEPTNNLATESKLDYASGTSRTTEMPTKGDGGALAASGAASVKSAVPTSAPPLTTTGRAPAPTKTSPPATAKASQVGGPVKATTAATPSRSPAGGRGPRRARLILRRFDPWSVMKFFFAVSLVMFVVMIVATAVLYLALDQMGVFNSVNKVLNDTLSQNGSSGGLRITALGVIGTSALLGAVGIVLITALGTLGSFIYNVCADLVGGIEVTLAEKD